MRLSNAERSRRYRARQADNEREILALLERLLEEVQAIRNELRLLRAGLPTGGTLH
jgi:hypothetical protein